MRTILKVLIFLMAAAVSAGASAQTNEVDAEIGRIKASLASAKSAKDSIPHLYNLFDLSTREQQKTVAHQIIETALRAKDYSTCLDVMRLVSSNYDNPKAFKKIIEAARKLPESKERDETILFMKMKLLAYDVKFMKEEARQKAIVKILASHDIYQGDDDDKDRKDDDETQDVHERLFQLFTLVQYLRNEASGDMLKEYFDQLNDLANNPDVELYAIRNLINTEAASIYSDAEDYEKSNEANRKLLDVISQLEAKYEKMGRNYRNYDVSRYVIYLRMMRNYEALSPAEVDDIYRKCLELSEKNSEIKGAKDTGPRLYAFYYMAKGDYEAAIPQLKKLLQIQNITPKFRQQILENLITAAEKTGDTKTRLEALTQHNALLEELNRTNAADKYKELQIKFDVESLKSRNANLELKSKEEDIKSARRIMTFVVVAFIIIAFVLFLSLFNWGKFTQNANRMGDVVDRINHESRQLRNSIYYDYATANSPDDDTARNGRHSWRKRMKAKGVSTKDVSMFMTESIVNDLIYIASFGGENHRKFVQEVSIDSILRKIEFRTNSICEGQGLLRVEAPDTDFKIEVDDECLVDVMIHILVKAVKASPANLAELLIRKGNHDNVEFVITVEGLRGASPQDPHVLDDYVTDKNILNREQGGLFICRLISLLLTSCHYPDTTYTDGARYVFTIPARPEK